MPLQSKPLDEKLAKRAKAAQTEDDIQLALNAIRAAGTKPNGQPNYSIRRAAKDFGVIRLTLQNRYKGKATRVKAQTSRQKLTPEQEDLFAAWIKVSQLKDRSCAQRDHNTEKRLLV
jgi:hypothetical protein